MANQTGVTLSEKLFQAVSANRQFETQAISFR